MEIWSTVQAYTNDSTPSEPRDEFGALLGNLLLSRHGFAQADDLSAREVGQDGRELLRARQVGRNRYRVWNRFVPFSRERERKKKIDRERLST